MERFARQLPLIGREGQQRLSDARVLIVGVGGLGSPVALYLAAAGVGTLGLIDDDTVNISNLQRQILYTEAEVDEKKVLCAARRLKQLNAAININAYPERITADNASSIIAEYDIVVDGCDNFATRYLLSDICMAQSKPYVYGAIRSTDGQVAVLCGSSRRECANVASDVEVKTYRDLYPDEDAMVNMQMTDNSVIGTTPAVVGSIQANEVIKLICGFGEPLVNKLWTIDLNTMQTHIFSI